MRKSIITELVNRGYNVEPVDVAKNGVTLHGIRLDNGTKVSPTVYAEDFDGKDIDEAVDRIIELFGESVDFDTDEITSRSYVLDHVKVGFQRAETTEDIIKKSSDLEGIEEYLYVFGNGFSYKLKEQHIQSLNIPEDEAWAMGYFSTRKTTTIQNLGEVMAEMMGITDDFDLCGAEMPMWVLSNKDKVRGASAWTDKETIRAWADRIGTTKIVVLPSSVHEMILVPYDSSMNLDELTSMVQAVNGQEVSPVDQLSDQAYVVEI